jgi:hypothetical protein
MKNIWSDGSMHVVLNVYTYCLLINTAIPRMIPRADKRVAHWILNLNKWTFQTSPVTCNIHQQEPTTDL